MTPARAFASRASVPAALCLLVTCTGCFGDAAVEVSLPTPVPTVPAALRCGAPLNPPPRLLTRDEYDRTLLELLGDDSAPARNFPPENEVLGFRNNAESHQVHTALLKSYLEAAEQIAARVRSNGLEQWLPCGEKNLACGETFVASFAPRAFRRPLEADEREALLATFEETFADQGFDTAVEWTLQVVLQSPQFLYRLEQTRGLPDASGRLALTPESLASRLSFFLWGSMPDEQLLAAARAGALSTAAGIEIEARRLLADPRAKAQVRDFHAQWLHLADVTTLEKNEAVFPELPVGIAASWSNSLGHFVDDAFWRGGSLSALLTWPVTFHDARMAPLYGADHASSGATPENFVALLDVPNERAGLLTQPALMALLASPDSSAPVRRGIFVREKLLCQTLGAPPVNVDTTPPDPDPSLTTRERFAEHTDRDECAGCHTLIDPVGFGFEHYDALGRFRETEAGRPVDASGELTGVEETSLAGRFDGALELSRRLAGSREVSDCLATQWFRFAMGRLEGSLDACHLRQIHERFSQSGGRFEDLLIAITTSDAFRFRSEATGAQP